MKAQEKPRSLESFIIETPASPEASHEATAESIPAAPPQATPELAAEPRVDILNGHVVDVLRGLPEKIVQTVVTSPPYWGLRDYSRCECAVTYHLSEQARAMAGIVDADAKSGNPRPSEPDPACPKCHGTGRDASLEAIWDDAGGCPHEWGDPVVTPGKTGGKDNPFAEKLRIKGVENYQEFGDSRSAFCVKCGAWKGQLGLEPTPELYVQHVVQVFREVRRVLRDDGTVWLNLGDCYAADRSYQVGQDIHGARGKLGDDRYNALPSRVPPGLKPKDMVGIPWAVAFALREDGWYLRSDPIWAKQNPMPESIDGWRWERHMLERTAVTEDGRRKRTRVRAKVTARRIGLDGAALEEVRDGEELPCPGCELCSPNAGLVLRRDSWRPTKGHEYVFFLAKSETYFADAEAVREPISESTLARARYHYPNAIDNPEYESKHDPGDFRRFPFMGHLVGQTPTPKHAIADPENRAKAGFGHDTGWSGADQAEYLERGRNLRTVWNIATEPYSEAHFATFPQKLVEPCVKAGTSEGGRCASCGAPWAPVVSRTVADPRPTAPDAEYGAASGGHSRSRSPSDFFGQALSTRRRVVGFRPTCGHGGDPLPCTVLDPFGGSGTVGAVARSLRRSAILVEIKEEYVRLARERVNLAQRTLGNFP